MNRPQRAYTTLATHEDRLRRQTRRVRRSGWRSPSLTRQATAAWRVSEQAIDLADEVRILLAWWQQDIMSVAGDDDATRSQLYDRVVQELRCREWRCPRIRVVRVRLENHRDELLAFAKQLDADLVALAEQFEVSEALLREVLAVQQMDSAQPRCWQRERRWWHQLGSRYVPLRDAVGRLASTVVRASSVVENGNSRLRNCFFLRKQLGLSYLALLQFCLNHRRLPRSVDRERAGKSPREVLRGEPHAHWLELLGYPRFHQAA